MQCSSPISLTFADQVKNAEHLEYNKLPLATCIDGLLVKRQLTGSNVFTWQQQVKRKSVRVMAIVLTLEKEVMGIICEYELQSGRPETEKICFYDKTSMG